MLGESLPASIVHQTQIVPFVPIVIVVEWMIVVVVVLIVAAIEEVSVFSKNSNSNRSRSSFTRICNSSSVIMIVEVVSP